MYKINMQFRSECRQCSVCGIKQGICGNIIRRSDPFALEYTPKSLCNIQMRTVRRQEKEKKTAFLPYRSELCKYSSSMDACIVKNHKGVFCDYHRQSVKEISHFLRCDAFICGEALIAVVAVNHPENVKPVASLRRDVDILTAKLPTVRYIPFGADVALIAEVKVYEPVICLYFEFLQLLALVRIELRRGFTLGTFSYTSISRANADKKALKVLSLASLPEACCHASLAFFTLCRSCSMAWRTDSSSEQSIIGLRPRPGLVSKPLTPSLSKRLTHELTEMCVISVCTPTSVNFKPCDFSRIARQRIRYAWLLPLRKPSSNCKRCWSVNCITLIIAIEWCLYVFTQS